jgi:hypothetical protein
MKKFNEWLAFKESVPQPAQPDYANSALLKDREEHAKRAEESKKFIDSVRKTFKRPLEDFEIGEHVDIRHANAIGSIQGILVRFPEGFRIIKYENFTPYNPENRDADGVPEVGAVELTPEEYDKGYDQHVINHRSKAGIPQSAETIYALVGNRKMRIGRNRNIDGDW